MLIAGDSGTKGTIKIAFNFLIGCNEIRKIMIIKSASSTTVTVTAHTSES